MSKKPQSSPNDQRSNVKNPNNPAYHKDQANRAAQRLTQQTERSPGSKPDGNA